MVHDTINSIRVTLSERIGNPFLSATLIACVLLNWELSLLLFSDVSYDTKVEKIVGLYPDSATRNLELFILPMFFGLFWTFAWPVINMGINAYWYWMKSNIANVKLRVERKKKLSEAEAAELYSTIDAQESRYLEFLKDRQAKIESLSDQMSKLMKERDDLQSEVEKTQLTYAELESKLSGSQRELSSIRESLSNVNRENDERRRTLDEISNRSIEFAEYLPGLKAITNAIAKTTNYHANETWIWEEFKRQEKSFPSEAQQLMLNFFLAIGLVIRDNNGNITFGERYRSAVGRVLGMYNNSPGIAAG